jgi:hypothetical protein
MRLSGLYIRYQVIKDFEKYLNHSDQADRILKGVQILADRAMRPGSKTLRRTCINSIKSIEKNVKSNVNSLEEDIAQTKDSASTIEKEQQLQQMTSLRDNIRNVLADIEN